MGTDIHMVVEVRGADGKWSAVVPEYPCWSCENAPPARETCRWCDGSGYKVYSSRNYDAFAILANVRNGRGFAGVPTGGGFKPIAEPRGVPEDYLGDLGDLGDHSISWLKLHELLRFDWEQRAVKVGVVSIEQFAAWERAGGGWPEEYCGGIDGGWVFHVSNETARGLVKDDYPGQVAEKVQNAQVRALPLGAYSSFYTSVRWEDSYAKCAGEFHSAFIPALCKLGTPENVRIVFGFDS